MSDESFTIAKLGKIVADALGLKAGMNVIVARDRLNPDRILVSVVREQQTSVKVQEAAKVVGGNS
ncbi:MAG: hypothetical protein ABSF09_08830 [Candidatus Bathyarchaeia archaeon]|jgi:hypothetical protein